MVPLHCEYDGIPRCSIQNTLERQEELFNTVLIDNTWNHILFAEHAPVYTYEPGKAPDERLFRGGTASSLKAPLIAVRRGGSITYHGPGQLVCYFIFDLMKSGISVFNFNAVMEMSVIELLACFRVSGTPKPDDLPEEASGIWVRGKDGVSRKIASRGLSYKEVANKGITRFGCALNVSTDLSWFDPIFPCGLDIEMTSVKKETGKILDVLDTAYILTEIFTKNFELLADDKKKRRSN